MKTNILKFTAFLLFIVGSLSACSKLQRLDLDGIVSAIPLDTITPILLLPDSMSFMPHIAPFDAEEQNLIIKTQAELDSLINVQSWLQIITDIEANIDFGIYQIIVITDKMRYNAGCRIDIEHIIEYTDKIIVTTSAGEKQMGIDSWCVPILIFKIPVATKNIEFKRIEYY
jgi:hypothetical protein